MDSAWDEVDGVHGEAQKYESDGELGDAVAVPVEDLQDRIQQHGMQ